MGGIDTLEEMTEEHLEALSGGELLRAEAGYFTQIRNTKKSSARLKEALLEQELALPLCILMAQQRHCIVFRESGTHLKLVSTLYDQTQDTLVQLGTFLPATASLEEYTRRVPPLPTLLGDFHIHADVAFFLARPALNYLQNLQKYTEAVQLVTAPLVEDLRPLYPPKVWDDLSPQFYMTFWCLSMYDLHVPSASYEKEINKLKQLIMQVDENKDLTQSKKKKEKERCHALIEKLAEEERKQQEHCARVQARLKAEKDSWFHSRSPKNETVTQFLQLCVFPRCVFTPLDALFCSRFVHLLHSLKTPNFSTLICYDRILCDITYTMTLCTENEASRYGRFLCGVLETVMRWHGDKANFEKECSNFPGFMTKFRIANQPSDNSTDHVDFENYRHVCYKWHFKITKVGI
ncbi:THOC2 [Cordylochernes scorpioides]|uniref:THOC2 n=1 Tax=Cordylochernes scorpioides TaxID=51811 RepID=A0ABY6K8S9_9ARAC|nr:THOC2 [Cordylochernes scorpioides]